MNKKFFLFTLSISAIVLGTHLSAFDQGLELGLGGGSISSECWNDCSVEFVPLQDGQTNILLYRGQAVVAADVAGAILDGADGNRMDAPLPPPSGDGARTDSFAGRGVDARGRSGIWVTTITWRFSGGVLRSATSETEFIPDVTEPPRECGSSEDCDS